MEGLVINRTMLGNYFTAGFLSFNGIYICDTLEDKYRDLHVTPKIKHETAIPMGVYPLIMSMSPRFQRVLPELLQVPNFSSIRIHSGSTINDTSGCVLVGVSSVPGYLINSRVTLCEVINLINKHKISIITIR